LVGTREALHRATVEPKVLARARPAPDAPAAREVVASLRTAIVERESRPVKAMTREERLEHIWSSTHDDYRGYAGERFSKHLWGKRTVLFYGGQRGTVLKLLDQLTDTEILAKLPVHLRYLPDAIAA